MTSRTRVGGKPAKFRVALIWARLLERKDSAPRTQATPVRLSLQ
jgi:hypothetical protein